MKKTVIISGCLMLLVVLTHPVFSGDSRSDGEHPMYGDHSETGEHWQNHGMNGKLNQEQRSRLNSLHSRFVDETAGLKNQIRDRSTELNNLLQMRDPDLRRARALQAEISDLRAKLDQEQLNYRIESRKITPMADDSRGYGSHHMGGSYSDMGYGSHHMEDDHHSSMGHEQHMEGYQGQHRGGHGSGGCN